tara:strand:+ start:40 stop:447 length:408 start_codon:yes stop_codon:yes gene_type:complete
MSIDKRSYPNTYFAWYNDDDRLALVCRVISADTGDLTEAQVDRYDTYSGSNVESGIRIHTHSKYGIVEEMTDDLRKHSGVDTSLHPAIVDYIKSRLLEDMGDLQRAAYYKSKYERTIKQYPHRKSGVRSLAVTRM